MNKMEEEYGSMVLDDYFDIIAKDIVNIIIKNINYLVPDVDPDQL